MTTRTRNIKDLRIGLFLTLALLALSGGSRLAHAAEKRLGVVTFKGPGEGKTRIVVSKVGKSKHYKIVGGDQIQSVARKLKVTLDTNDSFRAVARELGISAFVTGEVTTKKATLTVRNGADGSVSAEATWSGPNPKKLSATVGATFWRRLGSAIDRAKAPSGAKQAVVAEEAEPAPEPAAEEAGGDEDAEEKPAAKKKAPLAAADEPIDDSEREKPRRPFKKKIVDDAGESETQVSAKAEAEPEEDEASPGLEALMVSLGPRLMMRSLTYTDDIYRRNSKYTLGGAPELGLTADFYPMALSSTGFVANIGLTAEVSYLLPVVTSPAPSGTGTYGTYSLSWAIGAKVRLPKGLFAAVSYGDQRYQLTPTGGASGLDVPMVDYRFVRLGVGGRFRVSPVVSVMANMSYLRCLGLGQIGGVGYFPYGTCAALEVGAAIGYRFGSRFEVQVGADIRRYGLAFHVTPAEYTANMNTRVAGGAVDQYLTGWAAVAVVMGGVAGGASASSHADDEESEADADEKVSKSSDEDSEADADEKPIKKKKKKKSRVDDE
jgi:ASC-1-like (ASCH) protein